MLKHNNVDWNVKYRSLLFSDTQLSICAWFEFKDRRKIPLRIICQNLYWKHITASFHTFVLKVREKRHIRHKLQYLFSGEQDIHNTHISIGPSC
jgi:hypothetical protein